MSHHIVICSSTNQMLRANSLITEQKISTELIPVPAEFGHICNTAIKISSNHATQVESILKCGKVDFKKLVSLTPRRYEGIVEILKESNRDNFDEILLKINAGEELRHADLVYLLKNQVIEQRVFAVADKLRQEIIGEEVEVRAAIEFSNYCKKDCKYCGLRRSNKVLRRYRMSIEEILNAAKDLKKQGIKTVILQSGEDSWYDTDRIVETIKKIRREIGLRITLSLGERTKEEYARFREAGASNYLLKIETTDEVVFAEAHPDDCLETRIRHLEWLKEQGYLVGSGNIIGLPRQTVEHIAQDLIFFKKLGIHMVGIGPFIPAGNTPYSSLPVGELNLTLKTIAVTRLYLRNVFIPSTTALATLHPKAQEQGLLVGANKLMIIATPKKYRAAYNIYDDKKFVDLSFALNSIKVSGRKIPAAIEKSLRLQ